MDTNLSLEQLIAFRPPISVKRICELKQCSAEDVHAVARREGSVFHLPLAEQASRHRADTDAMIERVMAANRFAGGW